MTVHNYRMACAAATVTRSNKPCIECLERRSVLPALRYGCYRNSIAATIPLAGSIALHRRLDSFKRNVDMFIALTAFQRDMLMSIGLPKEKIAIKHHPLMVSTERVPWERREQKIVFIGRLYEAKGIHLLADAWMRWGESAPNLDIIGDGPIMHDLRRSLEASPARERVTLLGQLPRDETLLRLARAKLLIVPSTCFEGFPVVIQEAYSLGVPVVASRLGSLTELVQERVTGEYIDPSDPENIHSTVQRIWNDQTRLATYAEQARRVFIDKFSPEVSHSLLMDIYATAKQHRMAAKYS
jgi:glycosyltransferase involved in cell wall biosynthesis